MSRLFPFAWCWWYDCYFVLRPQKMIFNRSWSYSQIARARYRLSMHSRMHSPFACTLFDMRLRRNVFSDTTSVSSPRRANMSLHIKWPPTFRIPYPTNHSNLFRIYHTCVRHTHRFHPPPPIRLSITQTFCSVECVFCECAVIVRYTNCNSNSMWRVSARINMHMREREKKISSTPEMRLKWRRCANCITGHALDWNVFRICDCWKLHLLISDNKCAG